MAEARLVDLLLEVHLGAAEVHGLVVVLLGVVLQQLIIMVVQVLHLKEHFDVVLNCSFEKRTQPNDYDNDPNLYL